jgi:hypothetical protein
MGQSSPLPPNSMMSPCLQLKLSRKSLRTELLRIPQLKRFASPFQFISCHLIRNKHRSYQVIATPCQLPRISTATITTPLLLR